jgi:uncharacterized protein (TIGR00255 family)
VEELRKREAQLADDIKVSEDSIAAEIVMLADRTDITEEHTRINIHLAQFNKTIAYGGEVSKRMTYLLQEMHREATTIGS